jgi:hypothetical protein
MRLPLVSDHGWVGAAAPRFDRGFDNGFEYSITFKATMAIERTDEMECGRCRLVTGPNHVHGLEIRPGSDAPAVWGWCHFIDLGRPLGTNHPAGGRHATNQRRAANHF